MLLYDICRLIILIDHSLNDGSVAIDVRSIVLTGFVEEKEYHGA